jgi:hypothetical protein
VKKMRNGVDFWKTQHNKVIMNIRIVKRLTPKKKELSKRENAKGVFEQDKTL